MARKPFTEVQRWAAFIEKITINPTSGCWLWGAAKSHDGYAVAGTNQGGTFYVHVWMYQRLKRRTWNGQLDHLCRRRNCVNPDHLEPVTCRANLLRGVGLAAINAAKMMCDSGHPLSGENLYVWRGQRHCRICRRLAWRRLYQRRKTTSASRTKPSSRAQD